MTVTVTETQVIVVNDTTVRIITPQSTVRVMTPLLSPIATKNEGTTLTGRTTSLDFVGSGVNATNSGDAVTVTINSTGDVVGPASSTDNALTRYDGTTGKLIQNSSATLNDDGQLTLTSSGFSARKAYQTFKNASGYADATITEGSISGYGGVFQLNDGTGGAGYCRVEYSVGYPKIVTNQTSFSFLGSGFQARYTSAYIDFSVSGYTPLYLGSSSVGIFTSSPVSMFHVKNQAAGTIPFIVEMAASQTTNAFQIRNSSGTPIVYFAKEGDQTIANTYPWYGLKPTAWGTLFYFQAGVDLAGLTTGNYTLFLNPTGKGFSWNQGSTSNFVIDATTGYLGVNNTSPSYQFDVTGAAGSIAARIVGTPPASANNSSYSVFNVSGTSKSAGDQLWTLYTASFTPDNACRLTHYAAHFSPSNSNGITEFKGYSTYFAGYNNTSYGNIHGYYVTAPASVNPPSTLANFYGFYCGDLNASNVTYTNAPYSFYAVSGRAFLGDAFVINPSSASKIPLTLKLAASHTANALTIQNSSSVDLVTVSSAGRMALTTSFSAGNPIFKITATNDAGTSPYIMEVVTSSGNTMFGLSENSGNNKGIIYGVESIQGMSTISLSGSSVNSGAAINVASSNLTMGWYGAGTYSFIDSYSSVLAINSWQNTDVVISGTTAGAKLQINTVSASKKGVLIKMAATPTANPFEIQNSSGTALAYFTKDGVINATAIWCDGSQVFDTSGGLLDIGSAGGFTQAVLLQGASGSIVKLGGSTSSFPAIKQSGAAITFRLADDSANCDITARDITARSALWTRTATATSVSSAGETFIGVTDTTAARTITLSTADCVNGRLIEIKDESGGAGTNNITIDTQGSELIDGAASITITANYGIARLYSSGANWFTR